jgi:hypothetical protein
MTNNCPCCGRAYPKARTVAQPVNLAELPDKDVYAYYKRTAPVEDVKFQLEIKGLPDEVQLGYAVLLTTLEANGGKATPATRAEYKRLQQRFREIRHLEARARMTRRTRSGWLVTTAA